MQILMETGSSSKKQLYFHTGTFGSGKDIPKELLFEISTNSIKFCVINKEEKVFSDIYFRYDIALRNIVEVNKIIFSTISNFGIRERNISKVTLLWANRNFTIYPRLPKTTNFKHLYLVNKLPFPRFSQFIQEPLGEGTSCVYSIPLSVEKMFRRYFSEVENKHIVPSIFELNKNTENVATEKKIKMHITYLKPNIYVQVFSGDMQIFCNAFLLLRTIFMVQTIQKILDGLGEKKENTSILFRGDFIQIDEISKDLKEKEFSYHFFERKENSFSLPSELNSYPRHFLSYLFSFPSFQ